MGPDPQGFLAMNAARGIVSQAYSPIGSGGHGSSDILSGPLTTKIAKAHNKSTAQVALKYLVQLNAAVVTKSSSPEHLKQGVELNFGLVADAARHEGARRGDVRVGRHAVLRVRQPSSAATAIGATFRVRVRTSLCDSTVLLSRTAILLREANWRPA